MARPVWADLAVAAAVLGLVVHLPLPASGQSALSVRDRVETFFPEGDILADVVFRTIDSKNLRAGQSFSWTFDEPGGFAYHCHPHPWMRALVLVEAGPNDDPTVHEVAILEGMPDDPKAWGFWPENLTVREGDTVVWTNEGSVIHTVTGNMGPATTLEEAKAAVDDQQAAEAAVFVIAMLVGMGLALVVSLVLVRQMKRTGRLP